jgi:hypothetical protein
VGHALEDVTSGRDVLPYFRCWLLNDITCNVLHGLHVVVNFYPLRIMQMFILINK